MKKNKINRKQLGLDRLTIRLLVAPELHRAAGGMMDPTLGICGDSRGTACDSKQGCDTSLCI